MVTKKGILIFLNKWDLKQFYLFIAVMHKGELPFGCQLCNEKFSRRRALIMHRRTIHENKW